MTKIITKMNFREIRQSLGRYLAILLIIALGVGFFSGLKITRQAMQYTGNQYISSLSLFDFRLISSLGLTDDDIDVISAAKDVKAAAGAYQADFLYKNKSGSEAVLKAHSITQDVNELSLVCGRLPENSNECIGDARLFSEEDIMSVITLSDENSADTFDKFHSDSFTIVGIAFSPVYLNFERGSTPLGNGLVSGFICLPPEAFNFECYTEAYIKLTSDNFIFSDEYSDEIDSKEDYFSSLLENRADIRYESLRSDIESELTDAKEEYNGKLAEYDSGVSEYEKQRAEADAKISDAKNELRLSETALSEKEAEIDTNEADLKQKKSEIEQKLAYIEQIYSGAELEMNKTALISALGQVEAGLSQIPEYRGEIADAKNKISDGYAELEKSKADADAEFEKAKNELDDAKIQLDDAAKKIEDGDKQLSEFLPGDCYLLTRNENIGYACFENDTSIVDGIATVFPLFFFAVAALVCGTTMTRMVDEQRTQIGTLKAIGYSKARIMKKYLYYSGSAAVIGCAVGYAAGIIAFPTVIWKVYDIMYGFTALKLVFNMNLLLISLAVSLLCSVATTFFACKIELSSQPSELMRPKSPKAGKRVLLERIKPVWDHMKFLHKISIRNVFRYKKRLVMMVLGIGGCTALLLTGYGIRDSISNIVSFQFDEISLYDISASLSSPFDESALSDFDSDFSGFAESYKLVSESTANLVSGSLSKQVNMIVSDGENISEFISLHSGKKAIAYPEEGQAVINSKLAATLGLAEGDTAVIRDNDLKEYEVTVSGICDNYIYNYIYVSSKTMPDAVFKTLYINCREDEGAANAEQTDIIHRTSAKLLDYDGVINVSVNNDLKDRISGMMERLNYIVILIIFCAAALAFIVLYNLTNININERVREIATIKVLGLFRSETASYVFRENIIMTAFGALLGLLMGRYLHAFVMSQINIDMVSFDVRVAPLSYLLAVLLTFVFSAAVNLFMSVKIRNISMVESLKSIE